MHLHWNNIIAFALALTALVLLFQFRGPTTAFLASMPNIGPGHTIEEKTIGLIAFGVTAALLVAVLRILTRK